MKKRVPRMRGPLLRFTKEFCMYQGLGQGAARSVVIAGATVAGGAAVLPNTATNPFGAILAYAAITIGMAVLLSQVTVRVMRLLYKK